MAGAAGLVVAWVQANMSHRLPANQFVVGLVLNVLVLGVVGFLTSELEPRVDRGAPREDPAASARSR